jgi:hypothetical protein
MATTIVTEGRPASSTDTSNMTVTTTPKKLAKFDLFRAIFAQSYECTSGVVTLTDGRDDITATENNGSDTLYRAGEILNIAEICGLNAFITVENGKPAIRIF